MHTRWSFHLSALVMLAAALTALSLPAPAAEASLARRPRLGSLGRALLAPGVAWVLLWYVAVFVLLRIGFQLYQPTLLSAGTDDLRIHGLTLGGLNLVAGLSAFLVLRVHGRLGERRTAALVLLLMAASFAGLARPWPLLLGPLFCLQQISFGFLQPVGRTALNHRIAGPERASLLSAQSMLARLAFGLVLFGGSWDAALGPRLDLTYAVLAVVATGLAVLSLLAHSRRSFRLETPHRG
jgi:hypothetical protein